MKVFITGINGFVGKNLKSYLTKDFEVVGVSRNLTAGCLNYENFFQEKRNYDTIVHLSGKAHDLKKVAQPQEYYEANFELTKQVFDSFLLSKASVFIFMSTVKAVADKFEGVLTEDTIPNPKTHYGISKLQAENYILDQKLPEGKRVYILRPCMIHGPGNKGNLNLLYTLVKKGFPWPLGAFENQRSFLSIENLCFVIQELLNRNDITSGIYNVADEHSISTKQLIKLLSKSQNRQPKILSFPKKMISFLAKIGDILNLPLNTERLQKLTESYVVSNDKIINVMGKPFPVSAEEGLIKTFNSFRNGQ